MLLFILFFCLYFCLCLSRFCLRCNCRLCFLHTFCRLCWLHIFCFSLYIFSLSHRILRHGFLLLVPHLFILFFHHRAERFRMVFHNLRIRIGVFPLEITGSFPLKKSKQRQLPVHIFLQDKRTRHHCQHSKKSQTHESTDRLPGPCHRITSFKVSYDKNPGIMPVPVTQNHTSEKAIFSPSEIVKLRYFTVSSTSFGVTNML